MSRVAAWRSVSRPILVCGAGSLLEHVAEGLGAGRRHFRVVDRETLVGAKPSRYQRVLLASPPDPTALIAALAERRRSGRGLRLRPAHLTLLHHANAVPELPRLQPDDRLTVETFCVEERAVRVLLGRWPLHFSFDPRIGQRPHLLIAGLATPATTYLEHALRVIQYGELRPVITLMSYAPADDAASFRRSYPHAEQIAELRFIPLQEPLLRGLPPVTLALVSLSAAEDTTACVRRLKDAIQRDQGCSPPILAELGVQCAGGDVADWDGQTFPIAYLREACRAEVLLDGAGDALARSIHDHYRDTIAAQGRDPTREPAGQPWERLASSYRRANRHQADHLWAKLAVTDCRAVPEDMVVSFGFAPLEIERLAIIEHQRWAADRHMDGWSYAPKRDNQRKHHPQLIPFEALSEPMKDLDRFAVRGVPTLLARSGLGVVRMLIVAIPEPAGEIPETGRVERWMDEVMERLKARYPDRALMIAAALEPRIVRRAVRVASKRGEAGFIWLLRGPLSASLSTLPTADERRELLELGSRAERRVMLHGQDELRRWYAERAEIALVLGTDPSPGLPRKRVDLGRGLPAPAWSFEY